MKKFHIVSSDLPNGATWLVNCFLELGVKISGRGHENAWIEQGNAYVLNQRYEHLKQWLPALSNKDSFVFHTEYEATFSHCWPTVDLLQDPIIYFMRDPRDAIWSQYKRNKPELSFKEFVNLLNPETLLDKIDHWCLFNDLWIDRPNVRIFRFEDYKINAQETLEQVLQYVNFLTSPEAIEYAVAASTSQQASRAEKEYLQTDGKKTDQLINRSGTVGEWSSQSSEVLEVMLEIEERTSYLLKRFSYAHKDSGIRPIRDYIDHMNLLPFFDDVTLPMTLIKNKAISDIYFSQPSYLTAIVKSLDINKLMKSKFTNFNLATFYHSVGQYLERLRLDLGEREKLIAVSPSLAEFLSQNANANVWIFGTGRGGDDVLNAIQTCNRRFGASVHIKGFLDNDPVKAGRLYRGLTVENPHLQIIGENEMIIIASVTYYEAIEAQLLNLGIPKNRLLAGASS